MGQDELAEAERRRLQKEHRERFDAFAALGFDELAALALAASQASVSYVRETLIERGATHDQAARCVL